MDVLVYIIESVKGGRQWKNSISPKYHQIWYTGFFYIDKPLLAFVACVDTILVVFQTSRFRVCGWLCGRKVKNRYPPNPTKFGIHTSL